MSDDSLNRREVLQRSSAVLALPATSLAATGAPAADPPGRKVRVAIVGGGFGASFHWHEDPACVVTGVSDLRAERRDLLRKRYRCDVVYDSLETMIREAKDIDAVAVFTEAPTHARHVWMCLERGWHVISAVPACLTLAEAAQLKEVKEKTGLHYMMAETSYYRHPCIAARQLYREGKFGELFYSEVEYYHPQVCGKASPLSFYQGKRTWRYGYPPMLYPTHGGTARRRRCGTTSTATRSTSVQPCSRQIRTTSAGATSSGTASRTASGPSGSGPGWPSICPAPGASRFGFRDRARRPGSGCPTTGRRSRSGCATTAAMADPTRF